MAYSNSDHESYDDECENESSEQPTSSEDIDDEDVEELLADGEKMRREKSASYDPTDDETGEYAMSESDPDEDEEITKRLEKLESNLKRIQRQQSDTLRLLRKIYKALPKSSCVRAAKNKKKSDEEPMQKQTSPLLSRPMKESTAKPTIKAAESDNFSALYDF